MTRISSRFFPIALIGGLLMTTFPAAAQDQTVNGNLSVTGSLDVSGNQITLGTQSSTYGAGFFYFDADTDTLGIHLNRATAAWLWKHNTNVSAMRLDAGHNLLLYNADGTTVGLTLNPASKTISFGDVSLYRTASGMLRTDGGIVVDGTLASGSFTSSGGTVTGGATGLALNAGGTNQSVTLSASGTGRINLGAGATDTFAGDLLPHAHDAFDLGQAAQRWRSAYIQDDTVTGSLLAESGVVSGGATGLSLVAGAVDQDVSVAASGTGNVVLSARNLRIFIDGAEVGRFAATGSLLLGTTADGGNGRVQLAAHTAPAGGIGFGTDTNLYRSAAGTLKTDGKLIVAGNARFDAAVRIAPQGDLSMGEFTSEP